MQCCTLRLLGLMLMLNVFIFVMVSVSRNSGQDKKSPAKLLVPNEKFWGPAVPSGAYWNQEQRKLDDSHNPILLVDNSSGNTLHDSVNNTTSLAPCAPDLSVATKIKDYNSLPQRFKDFLMYMKCRLYPMVVDQPHICKDKPFLLLAIKSLAPHFDRRQAIRESWGRAGQMVNCTVATVFLLGNATEVDYFPQLSDILMYESSQHKDLLIWDYRDSFFNLTVKEVLFLDWFGRRCPEARFVFKGDDDVFVNTPRVLNFLNTLTPARAKDLFVGDVILNAGPHRDKKVKYYIPESMFVGPYPPYAGGGGFLYSGDVALRLRNISGLVSLYPIDDVYTGMCLRKLGLSPMKHQGFKTFDIQEKYRSNPCAYQSLMLVHSRTPQQMIQIWKWLRDPKLTCQ
ncbi:N-acetyllactosaminide beta-1,3-N-acetylglucosaminyltransferase 2 [Brienomyrus brachyistius]|uniref:N-acetyllactosaminide beta-1,3-N-acetylglucosaminyltransferase 2 n=1 Tax=Brienomyrus brachyistius TaxID=42636 RepID=UPI0020B38EBE|nr:N-acetyllactosaminide beta-1,3-N-acetylglucosaminyltransferase 2 [Brienomyrus brachyistius]